MTAPCPLCGAGSPFLAASTDRNRHTTPSVFDYFQCPACGLVFMDPIPADLRPFYEGGYSRIPATAREMHAIARPERYRLDPILQWHKSGKLLEIGPWIGVFSYNAQQAGFSVTTIEIDQRCVDFMNHTLGIRSIQSADPAATLNAMPESFDVIVLWHALEHLHQPWEMLRAAARRLAPGGILLIAIPNIESHEFALLHAAWRNLDAPRHLYFFPKRSLIRLCTPMGLQLVACTTTDRLSQLFHDETWNRLARDLVPVPYLRGLLLRLAKALAWRRARRDDAGPRLTALFQRPRSVSAASPAQTAPASAGRSASG